MYIDIYTNTHIYIYIYVYTYICTHMGLGTAEQTGRAQVAQRPRHQAPGGFEPRAWAPGAPLQGAFRGRLKGSFKVGAPLKGQLGLL